MKLHPLECTDAGWFTARTCRHPRSRRALGDFIFAAIDGDNRDVFYDDLRKPVWRGDE